MKVLKIVYKTKDNEIVRTVTFNRTGLSVILGNVINDKNLKETTNGVGKTIVMKTIDYLYGANSEKDFSEKLKDYYFEGTILINNEEHFVTRYFEKNGKIIFDNCQLSLEEYKQKIGVERNEIRKLLLLNVRNSISESPGIAYNINDLSSIFNLLNMNNISKLILEIKSKSNELGNIRDTEKRLLDLMEISSKDIDIRLAKNKDELSKAKIEEGKLKEEFQTLSINEENDSIQKQFELDNREVKKLRRENYLLESEMSQLNTYLNSVSTFALSSEEIEGIYEEAGLFLQQGIVVQLKEVEEFYKKLIEDRSKQICKRIKTIKSSVETNNIRILQLNKSLSDKSAVLSKNDAYQNAIVLLSDIQNKIEDLSIESGRLEQYSNLKKRESEITQELNRLYLNLNEEKTNLDNAINVFKNFVYQVSKKLYDDDEANLDIDFKSYREKGFPCSFSINFRKNQSGGVSLVKNVIFDYLLFKFDKNNKILLHDSNCFSDVDIRQVATLLKIGNEIAIGEDKQYIVALNEDSIHDSAFTLIQNKMVLRLSENDLLLKKKI